VSEKLSFLISQEGLCETEKFSELYRDKGEVRYLTTPVT